MTIVSAHPGASRVTCLRGRMGDLDGVIITELVNIRYLTGFTGSNATLVVGMDGAVLMTDGRYEGQAAMQLTGSGVGVAIARTIADEARAAKSALGPAQRVGFEARRMSWARHRSFDGALDGIELVPTEWLVENLRTQKDEQERRLIERAASIADRALLDTLPMITTGATEREVAAALDARMRQLGADDVGFGTIVAAGANAAEAHHPPSNHRIGPDELVIFDFGAEIDGYRSDTSRTCCLGRPDPEARKIFDIVVDAQANAVSAVRAGAKCGDVHDAAAAVLDRAGLAGKMPHGIGHGVGLEYHEVPWISSVPDYELQVGEVVTVEPGVYLPGRCGVRIEDTLAVTADGCTSFSKAPKRLDPR